MTVHQLIQELKRRPKHAIVTTHDSFLGKLGLNRKRIITVSEPTDVSIYDGKVVKSYPLTVNIG